MFQSRDEAMTYYRNETGLVSAIWRAIQREHPSAWLLKTHGNPYQRAGLPDLLMVIDGMFIGMEVKHQKPGESEQAALGRVTPLQRNEITHIITAGGMAGAVLSVEGALDMIRRAYLKYGKEPREKEQDR